MASQHPSIQITPKQARPLKRMAACEGKSVAKLICIRVDNLLRSYGVQDPVELRQKAMAAAGKYNRLEDLAEKLDAYLVDLGFEIKPYPR